MALAGDGIPDREQQAQNDGNEWDQPKEQADAQPGHVGLHDIGHTGSWFEPRVSLLSMDPPC